MKIEKLKELIKLVEESEISSLEIHYFLGKKIVIKKNQDHFAVQPVIAGPAAVAGTEAKSLPVKEESKPQEAEQAKEEVKEEELEAEKLYKLTAPMVGTFYRRPSPGSPPYVEVGDHIKPGQVVCLIEAMKLFNEVKSEVSGTIKKVLVEDASPVEFGQPLFLVELD